MSKKFSLGIDLGTSNSAVSLCQIDDESGASHAEGVPVTQIVAPSTIAERALLPSNLYLPPAGETADGTFSLPWDSGDATSVVGAFARERGAQVPDRVVSSAKSWLCNPHIDRHADILPWQSELEEGKVSPFEASRRYLEHMRRAVDHHFATSDAGVSLDDCRVVLTVPASFDEVARTLTHDAALAAGFSEVTLLEEPQAAFYAWIAQSDAAHGKPWNEQVSAGDLVLVVDVGGGTADFSLIAVAEAADGLSKNLELHRIAVGEHILLGGDNMDLGLAYALKGKLEEDGAELDAWQFQGLIHAAREAKEKLLSDDTLEEVPIAAASRSASLFASTLSTTLTREEVVAQLVEGYFPLTASDTFPAPRKSVGLQEFGLEYATEPAVSKHLARFLNRALENVRSDESLLSLIHDRPSLDGATILKPTAVLFNGGVFEAPVFRRRIVELLQSWLGADSREGADLKELSHAGLDVAVSRGAAYYGAVRSSGKGIRIRAGTSRSYYLGLESPAPAVPGYVPPVKGVCIVPQGTEEGTELELAGREFGLVTGEAVEFRFFSSEVRAGDRVGTLVNNAGKSLDELAGLTLTLPPVDAGAGEVVPVTLHPLVTEVGTLELWMQHTRSEKRWKLEFNLRAE